EIGCIARGYGRAFGSRAARGTRAALRVERRRTDLVGACRQGCAIQEGRQSDRIYIGGRNRRAPACAANPTSDFLGEIRPARVVVGESDGAWSDGNRPFS